MPPPPDGSTLRVCEIARGGMGVVELVVQGEGDAQRWLARKRLHPHLREDPGVREMFLDEARLAGCIRHANVVHVVDVGEDADGPYLLMEHVRGVSVSAIVARASERGERVPVQIAVRLALEAARGLHAAHEATSAEGSPLGLVHRDVSPQNLLVGADGVVRVVDFGIAKALGNSQRTATGLLKGKVGYLAPEQLRFEGVDRRTDLYALGVTLYEVLAGERLYPEKEMAAAARRALEEPPPDLGEVRPDAPPELVELLIELLAKDPALRPPTAQAVAERLEEILVSLVEAEGSLELGPYVDSHFGEALRADTETLGRSVVAAVTAGARRRRRRWGVGLAGAGVAAIVAVVASRGPGPLPSPGGARTVWAGAGYHTCALREGALLCWGKNNDGQLGIDGTTDQPFPKPVAAGKGFRAVALGGFHTCAAAHDGKVSCWGRNEEGQLGDGAAEERLVPGPVPGIVDAVALSAGFHFTCAALADGRVSCWGANRSGQVGQPPSTPLVRRPTPVAGLDGVVELASGGEFSCARRRGGDVLCWGANQERQLGDPALALSPRPIRVPELDDAVELAAGGDQACARRRSGRVVCWGSTALGENGQDPRVRNRPEELAGLGGAVRIAVAGLHGCALNASGAVLCWGSNDFGQLGQPGRPSAFAPSAVPALPPSFDLAVGGNYACARHGQGLSCWGGNTVGQLGDATKDRKHRPVSVAGF